MEAFANAGGLIPEQVWDAHDIPERELYFGRPSGSGMPLVWAHAEHLKLRRSLRDGAIFDLPPQTVRRYLRDKTRSPRMVWRFNHKVRSIPIHKILRVETLAASIVRWSADDWKTVREGQTQDTGLGIQFVDLPTEQLEEQTDIKFTFYWSDAGRWEGRNFAVRISAGSEACGRDHEASAT
jgi:glucoamylase